MDVLEPVAGRASYDVQWRGKHYLVTNLYAEDADTAREQAPDRRVFLLELPTGEVRPVPGYRGDGQALSRRGLPVCDARLLVNLTGASEGDTILDPFAGIGGIVLAARATHRRVLSLDIDPALRFGLAQFGARHAVGDARCLPYRDASIAAIATEPPYDEDTLSMVVKSLGEMARVIQPGGRLTMLCAPAQADALRDQTHLPLKLWLDEAVNRKGLPCVLLAWVKVV